MDALKQQQGGICNDALPKEPTHNKSNNKGMAQQKIEDATTQFKGVQQKIQELHDDAMEGGFQQKWIEDLNDLEKNHNNPFAYGNKLVVYEEQGHLA